ncbi:unnamed protein product, partial [Iphiclides podalirius]
MAVLYQAVCSFIVCYACLTMGLMYAWPSSTLRLFSSANTTLNRPMSETEVALLGSLSSIGALLGTPVSGFLLDTLGRKYSCMLFSLPQVIAWAIVSMSNRVEAILAAVFISGIGGCTLLVVPVYVSEFCVESIRGMMTSGAMISYGLGLLTSYLLGGCLEYNSMNYVFLSLSVLGVVMLWPLKESPMYLMKRGLEKDAAKAVAFYRQVKENSMVVANEIATMKRALNPELDDLTPEEEKLKPDLNTKEKISKWKFIKKSRSTRRAMYVSLTLYTAAIFQGLVVVQVYAEPLFEEAIPSMSTTLSSVLLAIITVIAGCVAAYLVDWAGRRVIMIFASIGAGVCCLVLGTQIHLQWGPHWITGVFIYLFCITYTFGAGTVPFVLVAEVFLPETSAKPEGLQVAWLIVSLSHRVEAVLAAMFISGFGGCILLLAPVFVSEFCEESVRGMMTSGSVVSYGLGILVSYLLGGCLEYETMIYVCLTMSVIGVVMLWPLKESPLHLMRKGLEKDAVETVAFYRRVKKSSNEVTQEIIAIKRALNPVLEDMTSEGEPLKAEIKKEQKISKWSFLKKSRSTRRALFVAVTLYTATMFQGLVAVQVYADLVFEEALPHIPSTVSCVVLAVLTVVTSCFTAYLMDIAGRRPLMIYSSLGAGVCCLVLGTQIHLHWGSHWITTVFIYLFCITYIFGAGTVPYVFAAEVFLPEIKSLVSMLSMEWAWMCNFVILYIFTPLVSAIGLGPVFYIFAGVCFASTLFSFFFLPETKGLPVDVIQTILVKKKEQKIAC